MKEIFYRLLMTSWGLQDDCSLTTFFQCFDPTKQQISIFQNHSVLSIELTSLILLHGQTNPLISHSWRQAVSWKNQPEKHVCTI